MLSSSNRSRRVARLAAAATAMTFVVLAMTAGSADAAITYCVNAPSCSGTTSASLGAALTAAAGSSGEDRIEIGSGSYSDGPWTAAPGNNVRIIGVGATRPVLTGTLGIGDGAVLTMNAGGSTLNNLEFTIPSGSNGKAGIQAGANAEINGVKVTGAGATNTIGITVTGNNSSKIENSDIALPCGVANDGMAIWLNTASSTRVYTSTLGGCAGILAENSNFLDFQRLKIDANRGVEFRNSSGTVSSSLIEFSAPAILTYQYGIRVNNLSGGSFSVYSANNTIIGHGASAFGVLSSLSGLGGTNTVRVNSNVIQGWSTSVDEEALLGSTDMAVTYSRYDLAPTLGTLTGSLLDAGDLGFVNALLGDYSLKRDSSLVDAGDPATISTGSQPLPAGRDLAGNDRQVNAVGTDAAARDIGAYEVQNAAPTAKINVLAADPQTGFPVKFSADGSADPDGDALSYLWTFDDGSTTAGSTAERLWQAIGIQTAQLKVTDSTGLNHTTTVQVNLKKGVATVSLPKASTKVDRQGRFAYKLSCPAIAIGSCAGRLTFKTATKIDTKRYGANTLRANKKIVKAGQYIFTLKPGQSKTLRVRTYRTFLKLLQKKRKVALRVTLNGRADNVDLSATPTDFVVKS